MWGSRVGLEVWRFGEGSTLISALLCAGAAGWLLVGCLGGRVGVGGGRTASEHGC